LPRRWPGHNRHKQRVETQSPSDRPGCLGCLANSSSKIALMQFQLPMNYPLFPRAAGCPPPSAAGPVLPLLARLGSARCLSHLAAVLTVLGAVAPGRASAVHPAKASAGSEGDALSASGGKRPYASLAPSNQAHQTMGTSPAVPILVTVISGPPDLSLTVSPTLKDMVRLLRGYLVLRRGGPAGRGPPRPGFYPLTPGVLRGLRRSLQHYVCTPTYPSILFRCCGFITLSRRPDW
jgi:hypothetical protein